MADKADKPALENAKTLFAPYLAAHPNSSIEEIGRPEGARIGIKKPWGEEGLAIFLPQNADRLANALNNLLLPEPFTAIWHKDTKNLEVIWTAYPLTGPFKEAVNRKFTFVYEGVEHECEFGASSDRLLVIAEHARPIGISATQHRNLQSFSDHIRWQSDTRGKPNAPKPPGEPLSFWIRNLEWNDDRIIRLARHLNFYLTYYDFKSPTMYSWPPKADEAEPRTRYVTGKFPARIEAQSVDDDLLHFWAACSAGDAGRKFVYYYRIIEHASYTYVERAVRLKLRKLLGVPHAFSDTRELADKVIAVALSSDMDDAARIAALLSDAVDPMLLWKEVIQNRPAFEAAVTFDGGYTIKPLITKDDTDTTFANNGLSRFAGHARGIRNHLSHGRDKTTQTSITPTEGNFRALEPWVSAISIAAGEIINHRHVL